MTSFAGLTNATSALDAQTYAMQITGQNIANADTPGYVRERADVEASGPATGVPTMYATPIRGAGTSSASGSSRLNDPIIDARARNEHASSGYLDTAASTLSDIQTNFNEPSDTGLAEQLNDFWKSWSSVVSAPNNTATMQTVLQQATTVTTMLNSTAAALSQQLSDTQASLGSSVTQMNTAAAAVGTLNTAIKVAQATGAPTGTLEDQRDTALATLASLGGASSQIQADGSVTVTMGGQTLVSGTTVNPLAVDGSSDVTISGNPVTLTGGSAAAQVQAIQTTIPNYQAQLDGVASALATSVNAIHETGFDSNGDAGGPFFSGTTAATISVAITDPKKVAISSTGSGTADLDTSIAQQIGALASSKTGADAAYASLVSTIGSDSARATQQSAVQDSVTSSVDTLQQSASGVSYDDEVTNLLAFQRAYQASSRVLTTIDDCLNTLINSTGRVGL